MAKYIKTIEVEAFQLPEKGNFELDNFFQWAEENGFEDYESGRDETMILYPNKDGGVLAEPTDWIVKTEIGIFIIVSAKEFETNYLPPPIKRNNQKQIVSPSKFIEIKHENSDSNQLINVDTISSVSNLDGKACIHFTDNDPENYAILNQSYEEIKNLLFFQP